MRKSTQYTLVNGLVLIAILLVSLVGVFALGFLLQEFLDDDVAVVITLGLGLAMAPLLVLLVIMYIRRSSHLSWKTNLARFPEVKSAIERYREKGESARRLLPAFLVNGGRYFLVKYGRKNREWAPGVPETGMLVLDEQGLVQSDEALFRSLLRSMRYVEESYLHDSLVAQENMMAVGRRMEREAAEARALFSRLVESAGQPELMEDIDGFLTKMTEHVQRLAAVIESEYHWCQKNRKRVEFTLEEMRPLWKVREEAHKWDIQTGRKIAQAWAKFEGHEATLESLAQGFRRDRAQLQKMLDALGVAAKAAADLDQSKMQVAPARIEAYRSRTARALQLEGQPQHAASAS